MFVKLLNSFWDETSGYYTKKNGLNVNAMREFNTTKKKNFFWGEFANKQIMNILYQILANYLQNICEYL